MHIANKSVLVITDKFYTKFLNKYKSIIFILLLFQGMSSFAQQSKLEGNVSDTGNKQPLFNATICLLRQKDSVLTRFIRSDHNGNFTINNIAEGDYVLQVYYPSFADFSDKISLNASSPPFKIALRAKSTLLADITLVSKLAAIRLKGDTLEYKADSFKLKDGAMVEDLLKRLPGIQVDKDGKITAMGESVQKVLVDGEEFFGDDPTIATKNIQADAIDKVQVFDKKSDQATFTGIDDGVKNKTINLKLKDDKKKGYFGKLELGGGTDDKWSNSLMLNKFKGKSKFSGYGIMSSTGKTGLNWEENGQYGETKNLDYNEDYGYFYSDYEHDDFGGSNYDGEGLPRNWAAGVNYSRKWDDDKQNINGSYLYKKLLTESNSNTYTKYIVDTNSTLNTYENKTTFNNRSRNSLNATYDWMIDSSVSIKLTAKGYADNNESNTSYNKNITNQLNQQVTQSKRTNNINGTSNNYKSSLLIKKKFKKQGRTISFNLDIAGNNTASDNYLYEHDTYYLPTTNDSITDQLKNNHTTTQIITGKIVYTEPLIKKVFMELNYSMNENKNNSEIKSFDKSASGKYDNENSLYSNHYQFDVFTNSGGVTLKYSGKKTSFYFGSNIANTHFTQEDLVTTNTTERYYFNLFPKAGFSHKFSQFKGININYNGSTKQPTITQIQPLRNNNDQLTIMIGNPLLQQEFKHNINLNYNSYKVMSESNIYLYSGGTITSNAIVTNNTTLVDSGKTTIQYTNVNGNYNAYGGMGYYCKIKKLDIRCSSGIDFNASRYISFVNSKKNITDNYTPGLRLWIGKEKEKKYNISYGCRLNYNISASSLQPGINNNYWTQVHNFDMNITLPWKLEINQEIEYTIRQKTALYNKNNNVVLWNAYIGRKILKDNKGMIKLSANDLLNQNIGYNRYVNNSTITENNYQTIARYFQVSFLWNFSKTPGSK